MTNEERLRWFLCNVVKTDGCWFWKGYLSDKGYGRFRLAGRNILAHRWSYEQFIGPVPDGMKVCHHCDCRNCVRPDHLFIGTDKDNGIDAAKKDRRRQKLTAEQVRQIRQLIAEGNGHSKVAAQFGVNQSNVTRIVNGQRRQYVS